MMITTIIEEINEIENNHVKEKISKAKNWFFRKANEINKCQAWLIKEKRKENQITNIRNKKGKITHDSINIKRILREHI